jgi:hypothetical protein
MLHARWYTATLVTPSSSWLNETNTGRVAAEWALEIV